MSRITIKEKEEFHTILDASIIKLNSKKNSRKIHWSNLSMEQLFKMLVIEVHELEYAVKFLTKREIVNELKDVINISMFIMHNILKCRC